MSLAETRPLQKRDDPRQDLSHPDAFYEVIDGKVVELPDIGVYAASIATAIVIVLGRYLKNQPTGRVFSEALFILDSDRNLRRRPDVSFLSFDRWPVDRAIPEEGDMPAVPDLAIEVISPGDLYKDVTRKLVDYFQHGVRQVWTVDPSQQQVWVHDSPNHVRILGPDDTLEAPDLLPGFSMPIAPLFKRTGG